MFSTRAFKYKPPKQLKANQPQINRAYSIKFYPNVKQKFTWGLLEDQTVNYVLFGGAAGGGKTRLGVSWQIYRRLKMPGTRGLICRETLTRLKESTLQTMFDVFREWDLTPGRDYVFNAQDMVFKFVNGSQIFLKELRRRPGDPNYERLGSLEVTDIFIDEASEIDQKAYEVLKTRIRYKLNEYGLIPKMLMGCNPTKKWLYSEFYKPHKEGTLPANMRFVQAFHTDEPRLAQSYIETLKTLVGNLRERLVNGNWEYDDDPTALFDRTQLEDMFRLAPSRANQKKYISVDPARMGKDRAVICLWDGLDCCKIKVFEQSLTTQLIEAIQLLAVEYNVPPSRIIVDQNDAQGAAIIDMLKCKGFLVNARPQETIKPNLLINYRNLRAQCVYLLSEMVASGQVTASGCAEDKELIIAELEQLKAIGHEDPKKRDVTAKARIKEAIGRSPDFADAFIMRMWFQWRELHLPQRLREITHEELAEDFEALSSNLQW